MDVNRTIYICRCRIEILYCCNMSYDRFDVYNALFHCLATNNQQCISGRLLKLLNYVLITIFMDRDRLKCKDNSDTSAYDNLKQIYVFDNC